MPTVWKKRFSEEEVAALIAVTQSVYGQLIGSLTNKVTSLEKEVMWQNIADSVNSGQSDVVRDKEKDGTIWKVRQKKIQSAQENHREDRWIHDATDKDIQIMNMVPAVSFQRLTGREKWASIGGHCKKTTMLPTYL